jgi:hypothetical protein
MHRIAILVTLGTVVLLLVVAQLVLPRIAEQVLRDRLSRSGTVISVSVSAFPAIELLWHHADSVDVHLASYHGSTGGLGRLLGQAGDVGTVDATVDKLVTGLVTLEDATMRKRGNVLTGRAILTDANLSAALPPGLQLQPVASGDGKLVLQGTALGITADATLQAQNGALLIEPDIPLIGAFLTLRVFSNPHVDVQGVGASRVPGGYALVVTARLR